MQRSHLPAAACLVTLGLLSGCGSAPPGDAVTDRDGDSYATPLDCDDENPFVHPGAEEVCDEVDNDCDGEVDEGLDEDADEDGSTACFDCDDSNALVHPGQVEDPANGVDDDCDGEVDEDPAASYPEAEAFFGLEVGNAWRYNELISGDVVPQEDDVFVDVLARWAGPELDPPWPEDIVAFEIKVDRLAGSDVTLWYGLDGSGALRWLKTRQHLDFFEFEDHEGDGSILMMAGTSDDDVLGQTGEAAWLLSDLAKLDFSWEASTVETFMYGDSKEVETAGLRIFEGSSPVGLQYFKAGWGLLGQEIEVGGELTQWIVTDCSICPPEAGL